MAWREKRRKLLLFIQTQVMHAGCMDILQELDVAEQRLTEGPSAAAAASAAHAAAAVSATADLRARFACSATLLLNLLLACGSADGSPLQPQHIARIRGLLRRFHGHIAAAGVVLLLRDCWAGSRAPDASLESLRLTDAPRSGSDGGAVSRSLLAVLSRPSAEETMEMFTSRGVLVTLDLISHGARDALSAFASLAAAQDAAAEEAAADPCTAFLRGLCALAAVDAAAGADVERAAAGAMPLLCGAVDHAALLQRAAAGTAPQAVQAFDGVVQTIYRGVCATSAPSLQDSPDLFEVCFWRGATSMMCLIYGVALMHAYEVVVPATCSAGQDAYPVIHRHSVQCDKPTWPGIARMHLHVFLGLVSAVPLVTVGTCACESPHMRAHIAYVATRGLIWIC